MKATAPTIAGSIRVNVPIDDCGDDMILEPVVEAQPEDRLVRLAEVFQVLASWGSMKSPTRHEPVIRY